MDGDSGPDRDELATGVDPDRATGRNAGIDRVRAAIATVPLLAIGVFNLLLILFWGVDYLWGFVVLVPVLFMSALAWFAFGTEAPDS